MDPLERAFLALVLVAASIALGFLLGLKYARKNLVAFIVAVTREDRRCHVCDALMVIELMCPAESGEPSHLCCKHRKAVDHAKKALQLRGSLLLAFGVGSPGLLRLGRASEDLEATIRRHHNQDRQRGRSKGQDRHRCGRQPLQKTYLTGLACELE